LSGLAPSPNSVFAVRFAHPNCVATSQNAECYMQSQTLLLKEDLRCKKTNKLKIE